MNLLVAELLQVTTTLPGGQVVHVRPIVPGDKAILQDGMHRMSPQSRHYRFFSPVHELTDEQLRYFTEIDYHDHFAFGAFIDDPDHPGIGVARYIRLRDEPGTAEFAVAVVDDWQGRGLGPLLLGAVILAARYNGFERVVGEILRDNGPMLRVSDRFGARIQNGDPGEIRAVIDVAPWADGVSGPPWDELRAVIAAVSPT